MAPIEVAPVEFGEAYREGIFPSKVENRGLFQGAALLAWGML